MRQLQSRLIRRALEIAGGFEQLRARLNVDDHALRMWIQDRATAPADVFGELVDLVLEDDVARAAQDRRQEPRAAENRVG